MKTREQFTENNIKRYFSSVKNYPLLSAEEEQTLAIQSASGDLASKERLINSNLRLVVKIAKSYLNIESSLNDLIQEGNIGLIRAAEKFDPSLGCRFSTYASYWIKHNISRFIAKRSRSIRMPIRKGDLYRKISRVRDEFLSVEGREPSIDEISGILNVDRKAIRDLVESFQPMVSIDSPISEDDFSLGDMIGDNEASRPEAKVVESELSEELTMALDELIGKEKEILSRRFGLYLKQPQTLKEIGSQMGVSAETIRQIEARALEKIRLRHSYLREYMLA